VATASLVFHSPFAVVAARVRVDQLRRRRRRRTADRGLCTHAMASVIPVVGMLMADLKSPAVETSATKNLFNPAADTLLSDLEYPVFEKSPKHLEHLLSPMEVMIGVTMIAEEISATMQLGTSSIVILSFPEQQLRMIL
jgi:hypothetical protein